MMSLPVRISTTESSEWKSVWTSSATSFLVGLLGRLMLGPTLGAIFFAFLIGTLLSVVGYTHRKQALYFSVLVGFIALLPAITVGSSAQFIQLAVCSYVSCILLVCGSILLRQLRMPADLSTTLVISSWLAWLGWPIYLSHAWVDSRLSNVLDKLSLINPPLVLNGLYPELGDWSHQSLAYSRLLNLGQDVPFALPKTIWPAIGAELLGIFIIAIVAILIKRLSKKRDA